MTEQLSGKAALVTGGTGGIGKGIALLLAQRGVRLIIVGRDADKGARAERELRDLSDNKNVEFFQSDLTLVQEAHRLADKVTNRWPAVHYLVHSAGIVRGRRVVTAEGPEPLRVDGPLASSAPGGGEAQRIGTNLGRRPSRLRWRDPLQRHQSH